MFLGRLSIGMRLAVVLAAILFICLVSSALAVLQFESSRDAVKRMLNQQVDTERLASDWYATVYASGLLAAAIARSSDDSLAGYYASTRDAIRVKIDGIQAAVQQRLTDAEGRARYERILGLRKTYLTALMSVYQLKQAGQAQQAQALYDGELSRASEVYLREVKAIMDDARRQMDESGRQVQTQQSRAAVLLSVCAGLALVLGALLAWWLTRSITRPLAQARRVAADIAAMDLSGQPGAYYAADETGQLLHSLDQMRAALRQALQDIQQAAQGVSTASDELTLGNRDLSGRTEQAASGLQQTASSMEEIAAAVQQTASSAQDANEIARRASSAAQDGGNVVGQVVASMQKISSSSVRISDITTLIDALAFQTNILALNAAVEAARAGEQGRGFAVVAGEVRSLAQRSAEAAREIRGLIDASVGEVNTGAQLAARAGESIEAIVSSSHRVSSLVSEITTAALEQSRGITEVNQVVSHLDQTTQQNAALVEQASAATESLRAQAGRLGEVVQRFKLQG
ncbi:MAG: hypothetical protein DI603_19290 [Roseateles depolymerans]|uniref:Methyl-accepting chemotaxis protein n=1 Tax=Roseateles depolymerans TaxID=76731 RepID=A0A2W5DDP1_9BURK|nr:MAG: hypothetical protein DI603_19290 [Roseateles depolymerans]